MCVCEAVKLHYLCIADVTRMIKLVDFCAQSLFDQ